MPVYRKNFRGDTLRAYGRARVRVVCGRVELACHVASQTLKTCVDSRSEDGAAPSKTHQDSPRLTKTHRARRAPSPSSMRTARAIQLTELDARPCLGQVNSPNYARWQCERRLGALRA